MNAKRHLQRLALLLLCVSMFSIVSPLPSAADSAPARVVRIGYIDYNGFISRQSDGSFSGYGVQYLKEISKYTGWQYEFVPDTWAHHLENLKNGSLDFVCHAQKTPEREQEYLFSRYSSGSESSILYVRPDETDCYYDDGASFNGMTIAMLSGSYQNVAFANYAESMGFSYQTDYYPTEQEAFAALDSGAADAVAMGSLAAKKGYKIVARYGSDPFFFMTGPSNTALLQELNHAMGEILSINPYFTSDLYKQYYDTADAAVSLSLTKQESEYVASCGPLTVAFVPNRAPFSSAGEDGTPVGILPDLMDLISQKSGLSFTYTLMPPGETSMQYLAQNPDQFVVGVMADNPAFAAEEYTLSQTILTSTIVLVCRPGSRYDLSGSTQYTLAIPQSYSALASFIRNNYPQYELLPCISTEECLMAVQSGKADLAAQNVDIVTPLLQNPHYANLTTLPAVFLDENLSVLGAAGPQSSTVINIINKCIATISRNERSQIMLQHTVTNMYVQTFGDTIYQYRIPLSVICILLFLSTFLFFHTLAARQRHYEQISAKNLQLAEAVRQEEKANHAKSDFLSRMSHEIRTPMNAIVGLTEIAKAHTDEPKLISGYLGKIDSASKVLLNIINDILDMSAIENGKMKIASSEFDIKHVLTDISTIYYPQCRAKGVQFVMATDISDEMLIGDPLRVNQILLNLISNAYKFTPSGGRIKVLVTEKSRREDAVFLQFVIEDNGCGMSKEMLGRLFSPFEQESAATAQKHGGSGLGTSIAKNIVDLMHGAISVESEVGRGTKFTVDLPFQIAGTPACRPDTSRMHDIRALIVDDDPSAREYTSIILNRVGIEFEVAESGERALEMLADAHDRGSGYDVCFLDWCMSGPAGAAVTKKIRELFDADTLVIVVSAYDLSEVESEAADAGADLFVAKPLFQSTVFNLLMQLSGGKYVKKTAHEAAYDFTGCRVLLAEDNDLNAEIATELLGMVHMGVDRAENGEKALQMFLAAPAGTYVSILMDLQMPVMDGLEATRRIRASAHPEAASVPIFAMTANAFNEDVAAALSVGMNGHIAKPIDTAYLYKTLDDAVRGRT